MAYIYKGKRYKVDIRSPKASAICDKTLIVMRHCDMVKQMEYYGDSLQWTGYMVGKWYADKPNPSLRPTNLKPDPVPVEDPRPLQQGQDSPPSQVTYNILNTIYFGA